MDRKTGQWMNANGCARRGSSGRFGGCIGRCNGGARVDPRGTGHPSWGTVGGRGSRQRAEITLPRVRLIPRDDGPSRGAWAGARRGPIARFHAMPGSVIAASAFPTIGANEIAAPRSRRACPLKPPNHPPPEPLLGKEINLPANRAIRRRPRGDVWVMTHRCDANGGRQRLSSLLRDLTRGMRAVVACAVLPRTESAASFKTGSGPYSYSYFTPAESRFAHGAGL